MPLPLLGLATGIGKKLLGGAKKTGTAVKSGAKKTISGGKFLAKKSVDKGADLAQSGVEVAKKGTTNVIKGAKFFKKKVGSVGGSISKRLKENATSIKNLLNKENKKQDKLRAKGTERKKKKESIEKKREKEKEVESKKSTSGPKRNILSGLAKSPLSILDKLFGFGGILLGGILVNSAKGLIDKAKQFVADNKELFDTIGNFLSGVKDAVVGLLDSFTGPESKEGAYDYLAKFDDSGKVTGGILFEVEKAFDNVANVINAVNKLTGGKGDIANFLYSDQGQVLAERGGKEGILDKNTDKFYEKPFTKQERQRYDRGDTQLGGTPTPSVSSSQQPSTSHSGQYGPLFEVISRGEGGVNSVNKGNAGDTPGGAKSIFGKNLTDMTVDEIYAAQRSGRVFAVGKFQIIDITMPGFIKYLKSRGIDTSTAKFTEKIQDYFKPYVVNYKRPIVGKYLRGESNNRAEAAQALAREFASIGASYPETIQGFQPADRGDTLYGGRGNNRASISPAKIEAALDTAKIKPKPKIKPVPDKKDQARAINQPDPADEEVATIFIQRVNTIQYVPFPVTA
jgi:hypothetical protein